jgi:hypothetical protein
MSKRNVPDLPDFRVTIWDSDRLTKGQRLFIALFELIHRNRSGLRVELLEDDNVVIWDDHNGGRFLQVVSTI